MKRYKIVRYNGTSAPWAEVVEATDVYTLMLNNLNGNHWDIVKIELIIDAEVPNG